MTVPSTTRRAGPYLGNGVTTSFPFTFKVFAKSDIALTLTNPAGISTALVLDSDYSVTLNVDQDATPGGSITYPLSGSPLATGATLVGVGSIPYDQTTSFPAGGPYRAETTEDTFDRTEFQIQQLAEAQGRALTLPPSAGGVNTALPNPLALALLGWNSDATALQNYELSTMVTSVAFGTARYDVFTGDGTTTAFTLSGEPGMLANIRVAVGAAVQTPGTDYTYVSGSKVLVFTSPPPATVTVLVQYSLALSQGYSDSAASIFIQDGTGAVQRYVQDKLRETKTPADYLAGDDATTLQRLLDACRGKTAYVIDGVYNIGSTMLVMDTAGSSLVLSENAAINYTGNTALKITADDCTVTGGRGAGFTGPATWDGTNTSPTYGVIWVTGRRCTIRATRLTNVKKVGLWFKDVEDGTVESCYIDGNYPSASWTGVETGHWAVVFDPGTGASGGNFKLTDNTIKGCVQGCQPGNYGVGGVVRGFTAVGNIFEGCWNHGIYSNFTHGAVITGNMFNRCQIPVVTSGDYNTISGNSMYTAQSTAGDERDVIGISVRDGSYNSITGNTLRGVLSPPSNGVAINVQDVSGAADLIGNVISGNTIDIPSGAGVAIRVSASTKTCSGNVISGNTVRAPGLATEGLIGVYGSTGKVGGNVTGVTKANPGVIAVTDPHGLAVNDPVTLVDFQGMTQINGKYLVNSTPTTTSLSVKTLAGVAVDSTAFTTWTSGGEVRKTAMMNAGNKVTGNNLIALGKSGGIYLICQQGAVVSGNTVEWQYNAGSAENNVLVGVFDSYRCASTLNTSLIRPNYGTNVSIQGFREYSGTLTQQVFSHFVSDNIDQVDTTAGGFFQAVESLAGSGLILNQSGAYVPSTACAVGSTFRNTAGGINSTFYVKQAGTGATGWAPVGVGMLDVDAASIANKAASINTSEKYTGKMVWDITNNRAMRALGAADVSGWRVIDGSLTVTPA